MNLTIEHMGNLFLVLALLFGFILIIYVNAEYLPDERDEEDEDQF